MKLIISDLDGTFYPIDNDPVQLKANQQALKRWLEAGNQFAVATGRGKQFLEHTYQRVGFKIPYIGSNGAEIIIDEHREIHKTLPYEIFYQLVEYIDEHKINAMCTTSIGDDWCYIKRDGYPWTEENFRVDFSIAMEIDYKAYDLNTPIPRIQIFTPQENRDILKKEIMDLNLPIVVTTSDYDLVDIGPLNASKGIAIKDLCRELNVDLNDVYVLGDSENDIPMLEVTENSYCMKHATDDVKAVSTYIRDSVSQIIDELLEK